MRNMLKQMSDEQLYEFSEIFEQELDRRNSLRRIRGYQWTTFMADRIRGPRKAPRPMRKAA